MKPVISETCIACGTCEALCPEVFKIEDQGDKMMAVVLPADYQKHKDKIDEALAACPVQAISWEE